MRKFQKGFGQTVKTVLSSLLALQLVLLLALAASPSLHQVLHHDSDKADHNCLVTAFVKGQLGEAIITPAFTIFIAFVICAVLRSGRLTQLPFEYRFARGRAPPRG